MTREEAIRELKADYCGNRIICELYPDQCNREDCEIWLAIKALVEQPIRVLETQPEVDKDTNVPINDTISRQSAIDAVNNIMPTKEGFYEPSEVLCELMQVPSAQPEIIMCKDCKHHRQNDYGDSWCGHPKGLDEFDLIPTDFCSRAERRTDGTE